MKEIIFMREIFLTAILLAACISDIFSRKIPNVLAASSLPVCLFFGLSAPHELSANYILIMTLLLVTLVFLFGIRRIGGGDIKLFFLVACALPGRAGLMIMVLSFPVNLLFGLARYRLTGKKDIPMAAGLFVSELAVLAVNGGL